MMFLLGLLIAVATADLAADSEGGVLPKQTIEAVDGIPTIRSYLEFAPEWRGAAEDRPVILVLHGNLLKIRSNPKVGSPPTPCLHPNPRRYLHD